MAEKDITEKTLEAFNDVFADIVNGFLFNGEQLIPEQALSDAQPFSMYKADGKIHELERDVAKYWNADTEECVNVRIAFLGLENQTRYDKDMPLRVIGYDGAAYRAELGRKERYPVLTIVLYFGDEPWGKNRSLYDSLTIPERLKPFINDYRINVFDVSHMCEEQLDYFHSDFKVVADYYVHSKNDPDYRPKNPSAFVHVDELLKMMGAITNDHRFIEIGLEEGGKPRDMCELLDRVEERGAQKKEAEVREEIATDMLRDNYPLSAIEKISKLSEDAIRQIAKTIGATVVL